MLYIPHDLEGKGGGKGGGGEGEDCCIFPHDLEGEGGGKEEKEEMEKEKKTVGYFHMI